jgi:hypothetical protein
MIEPIADTDWFFDWPTGYVRYRNGRREVRQDQSRQVSSQQNLTDKPTKTDVDRLLERIDSSQRTLIFEQEAEIARLRLTDAEREAIAYYLGTGGPYGVDATLVALLSRTGSDGEEAADEATRCRKHGKECPERERLEELRAAADQADVEYRDEIARLRLTDEEREAVERAADLIDAKTCGDSSTLRALLERLSP